MMYATKRTRWLSVFAALLTLMLGLACCATAQADTQSDLVTVLLNGEEVTGNASLPVKEGDKLRLEFRKCPFSVDIALRAGSTDDLDVHGITLDSVANADVVTQAGYVYEYTFGPLEEAGVPYGYVSLNVAYRNVTAAPLVNLVLFPEGQAALHVANIQYKEDLIINWDAFDGASLYTVVLYDENDKVLHNGGKMSGTSIDLAAAMQDTPSHRWRANYEYRVEIAAYTADGQRISIETPYTFTLPPLVPVNPVIKLTKALRQSDQEKVEDLLEWQGTWADLVDSGEKTVYLDKTTSQLNATTRYKAYNLQKSGATLRLVVPDDSELRYLLPQDATVAVQMPDLRVGFQSGSIFQAGRELYLSFYNTADEWADISYAWYVQKGSDDPILVGTKTKYTIQAEYEGYTIWAVATNMGRVASTEKRFIESDAVWINFDEDTATLTVYGYLWDMYPERIYPAIRVNGEMILATNWMLWKQSDPPVQVNLFELFANAEFSGDYELFIWNKKKETYSSNVISGTFIPVDLRADGSIDRSDPRTLQEILREDRLLTGTFATYIINNIDAAYESSLEGVSASGHVGLYPMSYKPAALDSTVEKLYLHELTVQNDQGSVTILSDAVGANGIPVVGYADFSASLDDKLYLNYTTVEGVDHYVIESDGPYETPINVYGDGQWDTLHNFFNLLGGRVPEGNYTFTMYAVDSEGERISQKATFTQKWDWLDLKPVTLYRPLVEGKTVGECITITGTAVSRLDGYAKLQVLAYKDGGAGGTAYSLDTPIVDLYDAGFTSIKLSARYNNEASVEHSTQENIVLLDGGISAESISLDKTEVSLGKGQSVQLTATVTPADAYNRVATWSVSDDALISVDRNGLVTALASNGTATVTATSHNGKTATCTVNLLYTVTYTDGAEGAVFADQSYTAQDGDATPNFIGNPEREGYTFEGWDPAIANTVTGDVTYTAQWAVQMHTITFDPNGGTGEMASVSVAHGERYSMPECAFTAPEGKVFLRWSTEAAGGATSKPGDKIKVTSDRTMYAQWGDAITIIYDMNGGAGTPPATQTVAQGAGVYISSKPHDAYLENYDYLGWNTQPDGSGTDYVDGDFEKFTQSTTLYARWVEHQHSYDGQYWWDENHHWHQCKHATYFDCPTADLGRKDEAPHSFNAEGQCICGYEVVIYTVTWRDENGNEVGTEFVAAGGSVTMAPAVPEKEGHTGAWNHDGTNINADTDIFPYYLPNTYAIILDIADGQESQRYSAQFGTPVAFPDPTREGYIFLGWEPALPEIMPAYDLQATAQWQAEEYTIHFMVDGEVYATITQPLGTAVTPPADPEREGLTFTGWDPEVPATMPIGGAYCYAQWQANEYTITFDTDGGTPIDPTTWMYNSYVVVAQEPVKPGYTFLGWEPAIPEFMPAHDLHVTAQWQVNEYTITFHTDGGTPIDPITQAFGTPVTAPADPVWEGYIFRGWDQPFPETMPASNMHLFAEWERETYTVKFDGTAGHTGTMAPQIFTYGESQALSPNGFTRESNRFMGWSKTFLGPVDYVDGQEIIVTEDMTLYAVWEQEYTITVIGGTIAETGLTSGKYLYGEQVQICADPISEEEQGKKKFSHWKDQTEYQFYQGEVYTHTVNFHTTFTAQWDYKLFVDLTPEISNIVIIEGAPDMWTVAGGWIDIIGLGGFDPSRLTIVTEDGTPVSVSPAGDDTVTIEMPESAIYISYIPRENTVTFVDWDGTVLKTETVKDGNAATAPEDPSREGYVFEGWDVSFDIVTNDLTVTAQYDKINTAVVASSPFAASITVSPETYTEPCLLTITFDLDRNYPMQVKEVKVYDSNSIALGYATQDPSNPRVFTFMAPDDDVRIEPVYEPQEGSENYYAVTVDESITNGVLEANPRAAAADTTIVVTCQPNAGYGISSLIIDGERITVSETGAYYEFKMPDHDVFITAEFELREYDIHYTVAGGHDEDGSVSGPAAAKAGETVKLTVSPARGCQVRHIFVYNFRTYEEDYLEPDANGQYSFIMPADQVDIRYEFDQVAYYVTLAPTENGTVALVDDYDGPFDAGDEVQLIITPDEGYMLDAVQVKGDRDGSWYYSGSKNSFDIINQSVTVTVTFKKNVTLTILRNGEEISDGDTVRMGDTLQAISNDKNVRFRWETSGDVQIAEGETLTLTEEMNDYPYIEVTAFDENAEYGSALFAVEKSYTVTLAPTEHGTVSFADGTTSFMLPDQWVSLDIQPDEGYEADDVIVVGESSGIEFSNPANENGFWMPAENVTVTVTFKEEPPELTVTRGGTELPNGELVNSGDELLATSDAENATFKWYIPGDTEVVLSRSASLKITPEMAEYSVIYLDAYDEGGTRFASMYFVLLETYKVTLAQTDHGTVTFAEGYANPFVPGSLVRLTITPDEGYAQDTVTVRDENNGDYGFDPATNSFLMPPENVTVTVTFKAEPVFTVTRNGEEISTYSDVSAGDVLKASVTGTDGEVSYLWYAEKEIDGETNVCTFSTSDSYTVRAADMEDAATPLVLIISIDGESKAIYYYNYTQSGPVLTVTRNGKAISSTWADIFPGDELKASVTGADGKVTYWWYVEKEVDGAYKVVTLSEADSYTVTEADMEGAVSDLILIVYIDGNYWRHINYIYMDAPALTVTRNGQEIGDGAKINATDELKASVTGTNGEVSYTWFVEKQNGAVVVSTSDSYTVNATNMEGTADLLSLDVKIDGMDFVLLSFVYDESSEPSEPTLTLTRNGAVISPEGTEVYPGDKLVASWSGTEKVTFKWVDVTFNTFETGDTYIVEAGLPLPNGKLYLDIYDENDQLLYTGWLNYVDPTFTVTRSGVELREDEYVFPGDVLIASHPGAAHFLWSYCGEVLSEDATCTVPQGGEEGDWVVVEAYDDEWTQIGNMRFLYKVRYTVTIAPTVHGTVTADKYAGYKDELIRLSLTPAEGYVRDTVTVTGDSGKTYDHYSDNSFLMPAENVTVTVTFKEDVTTGSVLTVTRNGQEIGDGAKITENDVLKASVTNPDGEVTYWWYVEKVVDGEHKAITLSEADSYTVTAADMEGAVTDLFLIVNIDEHYWTHCSYIFEATSQPEPDPVLTVTRNGAAISSGVYVYAGDELLASANVENASFKWYASGSEGVVELGTDASLKVTQEMIGYSLICVDAYDGNDTKFDTFTFYPLEVYTVTLADTQHGSVAFAPGYTSPFEPNRWFFLNIQPDEGYELGTVTVEGDSGEPYNFDYGDNSFLMPTENVTVTVTFEPEPHSIYYMRHNSLPEWGTVTGPESAGAGAKVVLTVTPAEGYQLKTLYLSLNAGEQSVTPDENGEYSFIMPAEFVHVYYTFAQETYTLTIDESIEHGMVTSTAPDASIPEDTSVSLIFFPEDGYELESLKINGQDVAVTAGMDTYIFNMPAEDVIITATFAPKTYSISYMDARGGSVTGPDSARMGDVIKLTVSPDVGYQITDMSVWNFAALSDFEVHPDENGEYSFIMPAGNVEVQYSFIQVRYIVTLMPTENGTVAFANGADSPFDPDTTVYLTITPDENYVLDEVIIEDENGFVYKNWFDAATSSFKMQYSNLIVTVTFKEDEKATYTVTFVDHDGTELKTETVEEGKAATAPADPTREGYTFIGWDVAFDNVTANLTVTAQYELIPVKTYTVTFVDHDGTELKTETVEEGKAATAPADPTREGYTFIGWDVAFDNVTANLTVTAQYELIPVKTYTVTFVDHDGTVLKTETVEEGKAATAPADPNREGYTFIGWDVAFDNVTANLTVTAQYELIPTYTLSVENGTGSGNYAEGVSVTITADAPETGKRFKEWTGVEGLTFTSGSNTTATATFTMPAHSVELTAVYEDIPATAYTVTFESNNGTGATTSVSGISGAYTLPECTFTAPSGMRFKAWSVNGNQYAPGAVIQVSADLTVIAVWETIPVPGNEPVIISPTTEQIVTVYEGEVATMSIVAEHAASYQWKVSDDGGRNWYNRGENSPIYISSPTKLENDGYLYKCVVTGENGKTIESHIFKLEVLEKIELPQTGDNSQIGLWLAMCWLSMVGILLLRKKPYSRS